MNILDANALFETVRKRKELSKEGILDHMDAENITYKRIEERMHTPKTNKLRQLADVEPLLHDSVILPYLDNQPMEAYAICDEIVNSLDSGDTARAVELLELLETYEGFGRPINRHFILSQKARLYVRQGKSPNTVLPLIREGLGITGLNPKKFSGKSLFLYEADLLLSLAWVHARDGDHPEALRIMEEILNGMRLMPSDEKSKEKRLAYMLLEMARLRYDAGDPLGALDACREGFDASAKRNNGGLCPDFLKMTAVVLHEKGGTCPDELYRLSIMAYCGYTALNKPILAREVYELAKEKFGLDLELYGMDKLSFPEKRKSAYKRTKPVDVSEFNLRLGAFREQGGYSQKEISRGLCSDSMLGRLETEPNKAVSYYLMNDLMERMGRDLSQYRSSFVSSMVREDMNLRNKIQVMLRQQKPDEAEAMLDVLAKSKDYQAKGAQYQYVLKARATIFSLRGKDNRRDPKYLEMLVEAIRITRPSFDEKDIKKYPLTLTEAVIINQMGIYYESLGDAENMERAVMVCGDLLDNIKTNWRDETLKAKMFATVSFNLSSYLGRLGQRKRADAVIEEAVGFEQRLDRLKILPRLLYNSAYIMKEEGRSRDDCLPLFALSFYVDMMFVDRGHAVNVDITREYIKDHYKLELAYSSSSGRVG